MEDGHFVGILGAVSGVGRVLNVPVSEFEHSHQVFVVVLEWKVMVVFRANTATLEILLCLAYSAKPG
jgi:hypothetical protein